MSLRTTAPAAVLFDLDGTLIDTAPDFHASVNRLRAAQGLPAIAYAPIRAAVSDGARAVIQAGFPQLHDGSADAESSTAEAERLRKAFLIDYEQHLADESVLFPGLAELLADLETRHIPWGIVTNKASTYTKPLLAALALTERSSATVSADEVSNTKPHPEPLLKAAALAGVTAADCIYVGDHPRDIEAGRRAGMLTVAVGWGYIHADDSAANWGADVVCDSVADFQTWLTSQLS